MLDSVFHQKAQDQLVKLSALVEPSSNMDLLGMIMVAMVLLDGMSHSLWSIISTRNLYFGTARCLYRDSCQGLMEREVAGCVVNVVVVLSMLL